MNLELNTKKKETEITIGLSGELNTLTSPSLNELIEQEIPAFQRLILDFAECDYVSSAGIRALLATLKSTKSEGKTMALTNVGPLFTEVLENTGLDAVFDII